MSGPSIQCINLTLQAAGAITHSLYGSFSAAKAQELVVAHGKSLSLYRPDIQYEEEDGVKYVSDAKCECVCTAEVFGLVRALAVVRFDGIPTDVVAVTSDSGNLTLLSFNETRRCFEAMQNEAFGKSGVRRSVPGQYLSVDPKGRALMVAAAEKSKLVYVLNRDVEGKEGDLAIGSPLEAHTAEALVFDVCAVDVGFENPMFACIEVDMGAELGEEGKPVKHLSWYELDLGLNHVSRKESKRTHDDAFQLVSVPGGDVGPGGVLVLCENAIVYQNTNQKPVQSGIPRREGTADSHKVMITCVSAFVQRKPRPMYFFLAQTEAGDVFKITLTVAKDEVTEINVSYFDTIPPCISMSILKSGFLFAAAEFGNHYLFQFLGLGEEQQICQVTNSDPVDFTFFTPRCPPVNLEIKDELPSLSPVLDMHVGNLSEEQSNQIYALCGKGCRSSLQVLRHGLPVTEMVSKDLMGTPNGVWGLPKSIEDLSTRFIITSMEHKTLVSEVLDDGTVQDVSEGSVFETTLPTLHACLMEGGNALQVLPTGYVLVKLDTMAVSKPDNSYVKIVACAANSKQLIVAGVDRRIRYYELRNDKMIELSHMDMKSDVSCLAIAPVREGYTRADLVAVGLTDSVVRLFKIEESNMMTSLSPQVVESIPSSLLLLNVDPEDPESLVLFGGLNNGSMFRSFIDKADYSVTEKRERVVGVTRVRMRPVVVQGHSAVLILSSRIWLAYRYQGRMKMSPLNYSYLEYASNFSSPDCPEGLVALAGNQLLVLAVSRLGETFDTHRIPLPFTPRKFVVDEATNQLVVIQGDQRIRSQDAEQKVTASEMDLEEEEEEEEFDVNKKRVFTGVPYAAQGEWAGSVAIVNPRNVQNPIVCTVPLDDNECPFALAVVPFLDEVPGQNRPGYVVVSTATGLRYSPHMAWDKCHIQVLAFAEDRNSLKLLHKTEVTQPCLALRAVGSELLAGIGSVLRVYALGQKALLMKCEKRQFETHINSINAVEDRLVIGDACENFSFVHYNNELKSKELTIMADCVTPRYLRGACVLDYDTVCGTDKFGNICITRLPRDISQSLAKDPSSMTMGNNAFGGSRDLPKLQDEVNFHVGEICTAVTKASLIPKASQVVMYSTIMGAVGCLVPFETSTEFSFFTNLEIAIGQVSPPLLGRDHMAYRSYYYPVRHCVDGDLCKAFLKLPPKAQLEVAEKMDTTPQVVARQIDNLIARVL
jgi:splicing factor 3B subunit 3